MAGKDSELERLRYEMDAAQREIDNIKSRLDPLSYRRDSIKSQIDSSNYRIADLKHSVDNEYQAVRICQQAHNKLDADNHRYRANSFKEALQREYDIKKGYYDQLNNIKYDFDSAVSALRDAKARKQRARDAFNARLAIVKAENERRKAEWKETHCRVCGKAIRYHVDWKRVPDLCPECKEKEKAKWRETNCKKCGKPIRYNIEWTHIPTICSTCKGKH